MLYCVAAGDFSYSVISMALAMTAWLDDGLRPGRVASVRQTCDTAFEVEITPTIGGLLSPAVAGTIAVTPAPPARIGGLVKFVAFVDDEARSYVKRANSEVAPRRNRFVRRSEISNITGRTGCSR